MYGLTLICWYLSLVLTTHINVQTQAKSTPGSASSSLLPCSRNLSLPCNPSFVKVKRGHKPYGEGSPKFSKATEYYARGYVSSGMHAVRLLGVSSCEWWRRMNHPWGKGQRQRRWSEQKSLSLTPFSNFSHHNKICREAALLPSSQTEAEPCRMPASRDISVPSCAPWRFSSDAGVGAARLKHSRFDRILK